jgi:hypothetical protein
VSWPFLIIYKGLKSEYNFKTCCLLLLHPPFNNLVMSDKSKALVTHVPHTSADVLYNLAMV